MEFASAYNNKIRSQFFPVGDSMTEQSHAKECDMNHILRKYKKTGLVDHFARYQGNYTDVTGAVDFKTALDIVHAGQDAFDSLPSDIRSRFKNDPSSFLDFVSNPDNAQEMFDLGLTSTPPEPVPAPEPVADPVVPAVADPVVEPTT